MTQLPVRALPSLLLSLAMMIATLALAGAAEAQRRPYGGGPSIGTIDPNRACRWRHVFFENCWWRVYRCGARTLRTVMLSCPDLPRR